MSDFCMTCEFIRDEAGTDEARCEDCREDHLMWQGRDDLRRELNSRMAS